MEAVLEISMFLVKLTASLKKTAKIMSPWTLHTFHAQPYKDALIVLNQRGDSLEIKVTVGQLLAIQFGK